MGLDRHLYFRSEVSKTIPTGKKWIHIQASIENEHPKKHEVISQHFSEQCSFKYLITFMLLI